MRAAVLLLFFADVSYPKACSYQDVLDSLNLTKGNELFKSTRPVLDHTHRTVLHLDVYLFAILAVNEKAQTFVSVIWIQMTWNDERISWDPSRFCGITRVSLPKELLWKPDLFIQEMTVRDQALPNPYILVSSEGIVTLEDDLKLISTCRMDVHKFPFDTQSCNITFSSIMFTVDELQLLPFSNSSRATQFSRQVIQTQGEWEFLHLSVTNQNFSLEEGDWEQIVYTITMKRRPLLHVINFLLPVLFFLCLDLSSFLISDHRGEKLGFKVTVLLAISVLLLILNDILPSMSNRTPLIATYCIVIFALMLLSLLETVLLMHLMEKDTLPEESEGLSGGERVVVEGAECCGCRGKTQARCGSTCDGSGGMPFELLPVTEEMSPQVREHRVLVMILKELRAMKTLVLSPSSSEEGARPGYWTRVASRINTAFFIFYVTVISLFLTLIYVEWTT